MKLRKLQLAIISLLFPAMSFAQPGVGAVTSVSPVDVDLGIKVGANFTSLAGGIWDNEYRTGFLGGAYGGFKIKRFGAQIELLYSRTKVTYKPSSLPGTFFNNAADSAKPNTFAVSNLSIPILLNVKVVGPLWFQIGPQYTNLISIGDDNGFLKDAESVFKSGELSGVFGLQANISKLNVGARYVLGLSDLNDSGVGNSWRNRTIQLHLGYSFL